MAIDYKQVLEKKYIKKQRHAKLIREMLQAKKQLGIVSLGKDDATSTAARLRPSPVIVQAREPDTEVIADTRPDPSIRRADRARERTRTRIQLTKKTRRGQPVLRYHVDRLLDKIRKSNSA